MTYCAGRADIELRGADLRGLTTVALPSHFDLSGDFSWSSFAELRLFAHELGPNRASCCLSGWFVGADFSRVELKNVVLSGDFTRSI